MGGRPEASLLDLLRETGALLEGHFLLSSGLHSGRYIQCARLLQHPVHAARVGAEIASACRSLGPEAVSAPAVGGIIVAHEVARALGTRALFSEREGGVMRFRRGFALQPGERVLVVEDVVTTGRSTLEAAGAVREAGGEVVGIGAIVDRGGGGSLPVPFHALLSLDTPAFDPGACPLCRAGAAPPVKPGSREMPADDAPARR